MPPFLLQFYNFVERGDLQDKKGVVLCKELRQGIRDGVNEKTEYLKKRTQCAKKDAQKGNITVKE